MRLSTIGIGAAAIVLGLLAVVATKSYLDNQRAMFARSAPKEVVETIVVAAEPLRFGQRLGPTVLREIPWPAGQRPVGSFATIEEMVKDGERQVLQPIETAEPVLAGKITGAGQRATLSATIAEGMKAMAIRVNDVNGVAGFVLPGDRVDIMLIRTQTRGDAGNNTYVDVLLQGVKVIAIDQVADERVEKPSIARTVTLEVNTEMAQRLTLAQAVGQLSLALRQVASPEVEMTRRISLDDLSSGASSASPILRASVSEDERFKQIEDLLTDVGSSLGNRIEGIKQELNAQTKVLETRDTVVNVYRNAQRTEYAVGSEVVETAAGTVETE